MCFEVCTEFIKSFQDLIINTYIYLHYNVNYRHHFMIVRKIYRRELTFLVKSHYITISENLESFSQNMTSTKLIKVLTSFVYFLKKSSKSFENFLKTFCFSPYGNMYLPPKKYPAFKQNLILIQTAFSAPDPYDVLYVGKTV